ncbi:MAG: leucine-rich repeat domain-containing protein [Promethearchaeia archaeon]
MNNLTPKEIFQAFKEKRLDNNDTANALIYFLRNSKKDHLRIDCLNYLIELNKKDDNFFEILENILVSDSNEIIRSKAAELIISIFSEKAFAPIKWALNNDKSEYCLRTIVYTIIQSNNNNLKKLLDQIKFVICNDCIVFPKKNTLNLSQKNLRAINSVIGLKNFKNLRELSLNDNILENIDGIDFFSELKSLFLHKNNIKKIKGLNNNLKLKKLFLQANLIEKISGLENLKELEILDLSFNKIEKIDGLDSLIKLKQLLLNFNNIREIQGLNDLCSLKTLLLRGNKISEIKGLDNLQKLERLELSDNDITEIKGLDNLRNLKYLALNDNKIKNVKGLEHLKKLEYLNLNNNEIKDITGLEGLNNLRYLYLENNYIENIEAIKDLNKLEVLNLRNNEINCIPYKLLRNPNLRELNITNCPITWDINRMLKEKRDSLNIIYYEKNFALYRQPIYKEISKIEIQELDIFNNLIKNELGKVNNVNVIIDIMTMVILKLIRYGNNQEFYRINRKGKIEKLK